MLNSSWVQPEEEDFNVKHNDSWPYGPEKRIESNFWAEAWASRIVPPKGNQGLFMLSLAKGLHSKKEGLRTHGVGFDQQFNYNPSSIIICFYRIFSIAIQVLNLQSKINTIHSDLFKFSHSQTFKFTFLGKISPNTNSNLLPRKTHLFHYGERK